VVGQHLNGLRSGDPLGHGRGRKSHRPRVAQRPVG
jgi:hypothetical protein